ncbi:thymidylate synthase [Xinfangfangia sp. CPCC 101601]|uniref:thymidylate synthase n=1 Tax=Pseudogemmobacter lacusdianii TaxID=3069608 RepID=A0ABU0VU17_9RHOB|nr:thymidylate synthase [Xinfangfangia sp. CPCC 101601]
MFDLLLDGKKRVVATKGSTFEEFGVTLGLRNPRFRVSRAESRQILISCLGELLWYLSGSDDLSHIKYYLPRYDKSAEEDGRIHGAYGPRLFNSNGTNQIEAAINILKRKGSSRRVAIQLFEARDLLSDYKDIPCTCTMQFMIRKNRLNMMVFMRSNDAYKGLPHDIFAFTMLQEMVARTLGVELGNYKHAIGSLHLYEADAEKAKSYLNEGFQDARPMPPMPLGDPWGSVKALLMAERDIRASGDLNVDTQELDNYWVDLIKILQAFAALKGRNIQRIKEIKSSMSSSFYGTYMNKVEKSAIPRQVQSEFSFGEVN